VAAAPELPDCTVASSSVISRTRWRRERGPGRIGTMSNADVVNAYFAAMRNKDASAHRELFCEDAELVNSFGTFVGVDAIARFYRDFAFTVDELWPEPGPLIVGDDRVAVELRARVNGEWTFGANFYTLRDGRIVRMEVYFRSPGTAS
jgi:ketosteroid isomerase-like protein